MQATSEISTQREVKSGEGKCYFIGYLLSFTGIPHSSFSQFSNGKKNNAFLFPFYSWESYNPSWVCLLSKGT
jgi:hypothetical protein